MHARVAVLVTVLAALPPAEAGGALLVADGRALVAPPRVREIEIVATGDLLIHQPLWARAWANGRGRYDFRPMFRAIRPIVRSADLALCHVETPMGAGPLSGYPVFNSPPELARAIAWAGWDACSTASNHSVDRGQEGIETTARALRRAGVRHTGSFRSPAQARRILFLDAGGVRVAFLSYTYGTNGIPAPHEWSVNIASEWKIARDARRARRRGADLVVVNVHWGSEYVHEPSGQQLALARALVKRRAADVIVGQHAHVVQPIRRIAGRFVVFGEGNLLSYQTARCCPAAAQDGLIAIIHVRAIGRLIRVTSIGYVPTRVRHPDFVVEPVGLRLRRLARQGKAVSAEAQALVESYRRTVAIVGRRPGIRPWPPSLEAARLR
jgi:poly-gamma-glutamate capsule biosynthesis protein CapA/YwtB (metallophosphatase superfamily)